ncbi:MAG: ABC transporter permease [Candidatus Altiarchaeota archaeon]|nr:ABC transporter permease [Candidatus Altiarchaeota archaeon]
MIVDMAFRELGRRKLRTFLTVLGVSIGILLVTTMASFSEGINVSIDENIEYLSGLITVIEDGVTLETSMLSRINEGLADEIGQLPDVDDYAMMMIGSAPGYGTIQGFPPNALELMGYDVGFEDGRLFDEGQPELLLGSKFAENNGLTVGDELMIQDKRYEVVGILAELGVPDDDTIMADLETTQEITGVEDEVSVIMVKPINTGEASILAREIERNFEGVQALTDEEVMAEINQLTGQLSVMTFGLGSIAAIIAGLGIMNVMFMSVRERRKEIGVMKALGATTTQVLTQVVLEALVMTLIGAVIGLILSTLTVAGLNAALGMTLAKITPGLIVTILVYAVILAVMSGFLPARQAAKLQPAVVLRYE